MSKKRLYILRHGNAETHNFKNDAARILTQEGIDEITSTAKQFEATGEVIDQIYVSPYVRAQETANHFLTDNKSSNKRDTLDLITPSGTAMEVALWLSQQESDTILLITHQPFASQLIELLADEILPTDFTMSTATLVALEGEYFATACCSLRWVIHAK